MNLREQLEKEITDKVMTKLASEKVELASVADLKKSVSALDKELESNFKKRNAFFKAKQDYSNSIKNIKAIRSAATKETKAFAEAAKDLGLTPDSVKEYKNALSIIDSVKKDLADAKKLL